MASNPDSRPLPDGWVTQFNSDYNTWFYVNKNAAGGPQSQWTHPSDDKAQYQPPTGPPPTGQASTPVGGALDEKTRGNEASSYYEQNPSGPNQYQSTPSYGQQSGGYNSPAPPMDQQQQQRSGGKLGGFLSKLQNKVGGGSQNRPYGGAGGGYPQQGGYQQGGYQQGGYQQGYPQQQGGYYPQQQGGYYPQQQGGMMGGGGMYGGGRRQGGGMGMGGAAALGVGGGLLGGMLLSNAMHDGQQDAYQDGYQDGQMDDMGGGDDFGGDF